MTETLSTIESTVNELNLIKTSNPGTNVELQNFAMDGGGGMRSSEVIPTIKRTIFKSPSTPNIDSLKTDLKALFESKKIETDIGDDIKITEEIKNPEEIEISTFFLDEIKVNKQNLRDIVTSNYITDILYDVINKMITSTTFNTSDNIQAFDMYCKDIKLSDTNTDGLSEILTNYIINTKELNEELKYKYNEMKKILKKKVLVGSSLSDEAEFTALPVVPGRWVRKGLVPSTAPTEPAAPPPVGPGAEPAEEPAAPPAKEHVERTATEEAAEDGEESAEEPAAPPAEEPVERTATEDGEESAAPAAAPAEAAETAAPAAIPAEEPAAPAAIPAEEPAAPAAADEPAPAAEATERAAAGGGLWGGGKSVGKGVGKGEGVGTANAQKILNAMIMNNICNLKGATSQYDKTQVNAINDKTVIDAYNNISGKIKPEKQKKTKTKKKKK